MNSPCDRHISRREDTVRHVSEALEPRVLLAAQLVKHFDTALALGPHIGDTLPTELTMAGDRLFFVADDGIHGSELWELPLPQATE